MDNIRVSHNDLEKLKKILIEQLVDAEQAVKHATSKKQQRKKAAKLNGIKSGKARQENSVDWQESKSAILLLARQNTGTYSANKLAEKAVKKELATRAPTTIAKDIRKDKEFSPHLKKQKKDK